MQPVAIFIRGPAWQLNDDDVEALFTLLPLLLLLFSLWPVRRKASESDTCLENAPSAAPRASFFSALSLGTMNGNALSTMNLYPLRPLPRLPQPCSLSHPDSMVVAAFTFPTGWPRDVTYSARMD